MIERDHGIATGTEAVDGRAVYQDYVEPAVVVAIEESGAATDGVEDVPRFGSGDMCAGDAKLPGDIPENRDGWEKIAIGFMLTGDWLGESRRDGNVLRALGLGEKYGGTQQKERDGDCGSRE
jgi:hypothetical protein